MAEFLLIRHGEPDYSEIDKRKYKGFGNDLAPLTENGIQQVINASKNSILSDVDLIITSPYTRTMHTASILSKGLNVDFKVELDLMEWIPDKTYSYDDYAQVVKWREIFDKNDGKHVSSSDNWEEKNEIFTRVQNVLKKYTNYSKVIVVTHGIVITTLTGVYKPHCAQIVKYDLKN